MNLWNIPSTNGLIAAGLILMFLTVGSVVVALLTRIHSTRDYRELQQRMRSWWTICVLMLPAILLGGIAALLLFAFISYLALKEYFSIIPTRRVDRRVLFWAYLAIPLQYWWIYSGWYGMFIIFIPIYMFLIIPMRLVSLQETKGFLRSVGTIQWGLMVNVFCLSHAALLFALPPEGNPGVGGTGLVLYLIFLTEMNDIAQFLWGKAFGSRKVIPEVSPNKTWGGLIGGIVSSMLLSYFIAPALTPLTVGASLLVGAGLGFFGFLGDVTVSALKRDLGIKDSGSMLPGHGGILDRIDSLLFTAPLFFHYIHHYYYGGL